MGEGRETLSHCLEEAPATPFIQGLSDLTNQGKARQDVGKNNSETASVMQMGL